MSGAAGAVERSETRDDRIQRLLLRWVAVEGGGGAEEVGRYTYEQFDITWADF